MFFPDLNDIKASAVSELLYKNVLDDVTGVVDSVEDSLQRPALGAVASVASAEMRAAELAHVSDLESFVGASVAKGQDVLKEAWDNFKTMCSDYVGMVGVLMSAGESLGALASEIAVMSAVPAGPTSTFAPAGIPMLTQLKGSVSSLKGLVGVLKSSLQTITMLGRQYGFIKLEGVAQWLSAATEALGMVDSLVSGIPVG